MSFFGHRKRLPRKTGSDPQRPGHYPPATQPAARTAYSIHAALPYVHQTASTIQLSSGYPHPHPHPYSPQPHSSLGSTLGKSQLNLTKWQSYTDLSERLVSETVDRANATKTELEIQLRECLSTSMDMSGVILRKLDSLITSMDEGLFTQKEDLVATYPSSSSPPTTTALSIFSKVYLYNNSRLPPHLPPLLITQQTHHLLPLAAHSSHSVYSPRPTPTTDPSYIRADARHGTKAMLIQSTAHDDKGTIVLAIRGTQSFRDWAVNMQTSPRSPRGFLRDPLNLCHAGFLSVAQKMLAPVAARLRQLIAENPSRTAYSLLITGHSAGGAVASLLYCHMVEGGVEESEVSALRGFFRRVHCVTFGAPPGEIDGVARAAGGVVVGGAGGGAEEIAWGSAFKRESGGMCGDGCDDARGRLWGSVDAYDGVVCDEDI
ncbi:hypothetical protein FE257_003671 [Aspergillus nanangensis]|uniref:Fungal lipase-type domain-containing protein n=1 Tax=Aspergillus nanangensis TaxID=2582783 RepID=A0AAD4GVF5_ASPNN|nr:hypothetical protein FE257_003671 [Aspergillus nanangensis]